MCGIVSSAKALVGRLGRGPAKVSYRGFGVRNREEIVDIGSSTAASYKCAILNIDGRRIVGERIPRKKENAQETVQVPHLA